VRNYLSSHFKLGNNVDLSGYLAYGGVGYTKWGTNGWEPIGGGALGTSERFTGSFDGAGFKISGLWINRPSSMVGLFSTLYTTWGVQNLGIEISSAGFFTSSHSILVGGPAGGVAAVVENGNIDNCYVTGGQITGGDNVTGGIAGTVSMGNISNCHSTCRISRGGSSGGVVGGFNSGSMTNCHSTGEINGYRSVGGVIGSLSSGSITNCYAIGAISSTDSSVGGVVGSLSSGSITNCYATGTVNGTFNVGGVVGRSDGFGHSKSITNCYATGAVSGTGDYIGGVVGYVIDNGSKITNCVALNLSVISSKNTVHIGRVAGFVLDFNMLDNNFAQNNMMVTANGVSKTIIKAGNMLDGADCVATPAANWWTTASPNGPGWSSTIWNFTSGQLPKLK